MASGVKVSDDVVEKYISMKMKKLHRYMIMRIENGLIIAKTLIEKTGNQEKDFEDLMENLPKDDSCYILLDLQVTGKKSGQVKEVLFVITWCPDCGKTKDKMVYASSKQSLMSKLNEGTIALQANDLTDLEYSGLLERGSK